MTSTATIGEPLQRDCPIRPSAPHLVIVNGPKTRVFFSDPHVAVTFCEAHHLVRYTRTREPYASLDVVRDVHQRIARTVDQLPQGALKLLVDVTEAPARNDDDFEAEIQRWLRAIVPRFVSRAVLVKSAAGRLQTLR